MTSHYHGDNNMRCPATNTNTSKWSPILQTSPLTEEASTHATPWHTAAVPPQKDTAPQWNSFTTEKNIFLLLFSRQNTISSGNKHRKFVDDCYSATIIATCILVTIQWPFFVQCTATWKKKNRTRVKLLALSVNFLVDLSSTFVDV